MRRVPENGQPRVPSLAMLEEWSARTGLRARKEMLHLGVPGSGYPEDRSGELACAQHPDATCGPSRRTLLDLLVRRLLPDPESPTGQTCGPHSPRELMIHHQQVSGCAFSQQR